MKIERTKNAARNIMFDGMLKLLNIVIPFFLRSTSTITSDIKRVTTISGRHAK